MSCIFPCCSCVYLCCRAVHIAYSKGSKSLHESLQVACVASQVCPVCGVQAEAVPLWAFLMLWALVLAGSWQCLLLGLALAAVRSHPRP